MGRNWVALTRVADLACPGKTTQISCKGLSVKATIIIIIRHHHHHHHHHHHPAGNRTTRGAPVHRIDTQTEVVRTCLPFIRFGQNHHAQHSKMGKKTRQTEKRGGKTLGNGQAWCLPSPRGQWRTEKNGGKLVMKSSVVPQRPLRFRDSYHHHQHHHQSWCEMTLAPSAGVERSLIR